MRKSTYRLFKETYQLLLVIGAAIALSFGFYMICATLKPETKDAITDEEQIEAMRDYHQTKSKNEILLF